MKNAILKKRLIAYLGKKKYNELFKLYSETFDTNHYRFYDYLFNMWTFYYNSFSYFVDELPETFDNIDIINLKSCLDDLFMNIR